MKKLKQEYLDIIDEIVAKHKDEMGPMKLMLHEIKKSLAIFLLKQWKKLQLLLMYQYQRYMVL